MARRPLNSRSSVALTRMFNRSRLVRMVSLLWSPAETAPKVGMPVAGFMPVMSRGVPAANRLLASYMSPRARKSPLNWKRAAMSQDSDFSSRSVSMSSTLSPYSVTVSFWRASCAFSSSTWRASSSILLSRSAAFCDPPAAARPGSAISPARASTEILLTIFLPPLRCNESACCGDFFRVGQAGRQWSSTTVDIPHGCRTVACRPENVNAPGREE